ncbi:Serine/threonine-protein kinase ZRK7 [Linum grandiflorum]
MAHISDIKLIRTDTTLDLSQKAEKGMIFSMLGAFVLYPVLLLFLTSKQCGIYLSAFSSANNSTPIYNFDKFNYLLLDCCHGHTYIFLHYVVSRFYQKFLHMHPPPPPHPVCLQLMLQRSNVSFTH